MNIVNKEPNMADMKKSIAKAGGLFYQYRPCRRNSSTIYDIENIRHGVVYAQTPLNMNDPFDSMIGFNAEKIYEECITMIADAIKIDDNIKPIISALLQHRAFGKVAELITSIKELKTYLLSRQRAMHQLSLSFEDFIVGNAKNLYSKLPKKLKTVFVYKAFISFALLISQLGSIEISEENIVEMLKLDEILDELRAKVEETRDFVYQPRLKQFLEEITISCFSTSGWDNQLMWAHYANSYSGICVEYDFTRINEFNGFIFPVEYTKKRPSVSLQDLGIAGFSYGDTEKPIISCEINISRVFSYLLSKNTCWQYEEEWRIINIGTANTPLFIDLPYVKSITLGINLDNQCRRLILEVCKERNISCYQLIIDKESFQLHREEISVDDLAFDADEEVEFIGLLSDQIKILSQEMEKSANIVSTGLTEGRLESATFKKTLELATDTLCDSYFLKISLNRICQNSDEDLSKIELPENIIEAVSGINDMVLQFEQSVGDLQLAIPGFVKKLLLQPQMAVGLKKQLNNIQELITKINEITWNPWLVGQKNEAEAKDDEEIMIISSQSEK